MKKLKRIFLWLTAVFLFFAGISVLLAWYYEDEIELLVIRELEENTHAEIEIEDTELFFLRTWPEVEVRLEGLKINPEGEKKAPWLLTTEALRLRVDFWSFFEDHYIIRKVILDEPVASLSADEGGKWNYEKILSDSASADTSLYSIQIDKFAITDGRLLVNNRQSGFYMDLDSLNLLIKGELATHDGEVDGSMDLIVRKIASGKTAFAENRFVTLETAALFAKEEAHTRFTLDQTLINIDYLKLKVSGDVLATQSGAELNLSFGTNENTFDGFLSIIPLPLLSNGHDYEYDGSFVLNGSVIGKADAKHIPVFAADFKVSEGSFNYTGYETGLSDVTLEGSFLFDEAHPALSHITVDRFFAGLKENKLQGSLKYRNFHDGELKFEVFGDLGLTNLQEFYPPFADSTRLEGKVFAELKAEGRMEDFKSGNFKKLSTSGWMNLEEVSVVDSRLAYPFEKLNGSIHLNNERIEVKSLFGLSGNSDFELGGTVSNYLGYLFDSTGTLNANLSLKSNHLALDDWMNENSDASGNKSYDLQIPDRLNFTFHSDVRSFSMDNFSARDFKGTFRVKGQSVTMDEIFMRAMEGEFTVNGKVELKKEVAATVELNLDVKQMNVNEALKTFGQWGDFTLMEENLYGSMSGKILIRGDINRQLELDQKSLYSEGDIVLKDGKLINYEPLEAFAGFIKIDKLRNVEFEDITTQYKIEKEWFYIPGMRLVAHEYQIDVAGRHGFDNTLEYNLRVELPRLWAQKSKEPKVFELVAEEDEKSARRIPIYVIVTGTVDDPHFKIDGKSYKQSVKEELKAEKQELKEKSQEETEYLFGEQDSSDIDDWIIEEGKAVKKDSSGKGVKKTIEKVKNWKLFKKSDEND